MTATPTLKMLPFVALAVLFSGAVLFAGSQWFLANQSTLSTPLTLDFILTIPFVYWLLIRKRSISNLTVVLVFIIGTLLASIYLPSEEQNLLAFVRSYAVPVIELGVFSLVIYKLRKSYRKLRAHTLEQPDFFTALRETTREIAPPRLAPLLATEIGIIYYGFLHWHRRPLAKNEFTYHQRSGTPALLMVLILLVVVETVAFHLLLHEWKPILAYILLVLSVYSGLQIFGFARSLSKRPIRLTKDHLFLPYGILAEASIPRADIASIERKRTSLSKDGAVLKLSPLGEIDSHNLILHLARPVEVTGLYGSTKTTSSLAIFVDQPDELVAGLEAGE